MKWQPRDVVVQKRQPHVGECHAPQMPAANRYIGDLINKPLLVVADDKTESGSAVTDRQ